MIQIPDNDLIQAVDIEQYVFADEVHPSRDIQNGYHINLYLRITFLENCNNFETIILQILLSACKLLLKEQKLKEEMNNNNNLKDYDWKL